eukprot:scaffold24393_cov112-Isochrysis_galbana.AAC.7
MSGSPLGGSFTGWLSASKRAGNRHTSLSTLSRTNADNSSTSASTAMQKRYAPQLNLHGLRLADRLNQHGQLLRFREFALQKAAVATDREVLLVAGELLKGVIDQSDARGRLLHIHQDHCERQLLYRLLNHLQPRTVFLELGVLIEGIQLATMQLLQKAHPFGRLHEETNVLADDWCQTLRLLIGCQILVECSLKCLVRPDRGNLLDKHFSETIYPTGGDQLLCEFGRKLTRCLRAKPQDGRQVSPVAHTEGSLEHTRVLLVKARGPAHILDAARRQHADDGIFGGCFGFREGRGAFLGLRARGAPRRTHVNVEREEARRAAGVCHRVHDQQVLEDLATPLVVCDAHAAALASPNRTVDHSDRTHFGIRALQEAAVAAKNLGLAVADGLAKGLVYIDERVSRDPHIGDCEALRHHVDDADDPEEPAGTIGRYLVPIPQQVRQAGHAGLHA